MDDLEERGGLAVAGALSRYFWCGTQKTREDLLVLGGAYGAAGQQSCLQCVHGVTP